MPLAIRSIEFIGITCVFDRRLNISCLGAVCLRIGEEYNLLNGMNKMDSWGGTVGI